MTVSNGGFLVRTAPEAAIGSWISVVNKSLISPAPTKAAYFKEVLIDVNLVLSLVPSPFTTAMMASEIPAAIRPYSMAVAPDSSARNALIVFMPVYKPQKVLNSI